MRQAITWTNDDLLSIVPSETNFSDLFYGNYNTIDEIA